METVPESVEALLEFATEEAGQTEIASEVKDNEAVFTVV